MALLRALHILETVGTFNLYIYKKKDIYIYNALTILVCIFVHHIISSIELNVLYRNNGGQCIMVQDQINTNCASIAG